MTQDFAIVWGIGNGHLNFLSSLEYNMPINLESFGTKDSFNSYMEFFMHIARIKTPCAFMQQCS